MIPGVPVRQEERQGNDDAHLMVRPSFDNDITEKLGCVLTWSESRKFVGLHPAILAVGRLGCRCCHHSLFTHSPKEQRSKSKMKCTALLLAAVATSAQAFSYLDSLGGSAPAPAKSYAPSKPSASAPAAGGAKKGATVPDDAKLFGHVPVAPVAADYVAPTAQWGENPTVSHGSSILDNLLFCIIYFYSDILI